MDKFKMELTWHNCKTCPPEEEFNPWLIYTDGSTVYDIEYCKEYGFPVKKECLHKFWWADIEQTVRNTKEFRE